VRGKFRGQPRGVYLLFATEFWERFSYFGFMGILTLFTIASPAQGGMGYTRASAVFLFGSITSLIWIAPILGGWVSDRLIGPRIAVLAGCTGIALGNYLLAGASWSAAAGLGHRATTLFVAGLASMIIGAGLFKSNASALLGTLFAPGDQRRETGFILFYMGINLGALVAPFGAGTLGERLGWGWGFALAGVGMTAGLGLFAMKGLRYFPDSISRAPARAAADASGGLLANRNVQLILLMALFTIVYMTGQMTYGGIMNLYASYRIDRAVFSFVIPSTWFLCLNPLMVLVLGGPVASFWRNRADRTQRVLFVEKIVVGLFLMACSFAVMMIAETVHSGGLQSPLLLLAFYLLITSAELCVLPAGLVEISRRAPPAATGVLMGVWIFTMGAGSFLSGYLGSLISHRSLAYIFAILMGSGFIASLILAGLEPTLRRYMGNLSRVPA
jgi:proton-dependent oligopeptide transporter, POT family